MPSGLYVVGARDGDRRKRDDAQLGDARSASSRSWSGSAWRRRAFTHELIAGGRSFQPQPPAPGGAGGGPEVCEAGRGRRRRQDSQWVRLPRWGGPAPPILDIAAALGRLPAAPVGRLRGPHVSSSARSSTPGFPGRRGDARPPAWRTPACPTAAEQRFAPDGGGQTPQRGTVKRGAAVARPSGVPILGEMEGAPVGAAGVFSVSPLFGVSGVRLGFPRPPASWSACLGPICGEGRQRACLGLLPTGRFRIYSVVGRLPHRAPADWRLDVDGLAGTPLRASATTSCSGCRPSS